VASGTGVSMDWYASSGLRCSGVTEEQLAAAGVTLRAPLPETALVQVVRNAAFVVHPSGNLDETDTHRFIARLSLPSKLPFVLACTHAPTLVLGHPETAAARFVVRNGIGLAIPYERRAFEDAVAELCRPQVQERMRARAASLAERFSSRGARDWIFRSLELGRAADDRFESLFPPPETERPLLEIRRS